MLQMLALQQRVSIRKARSHWCSLGVLQHQVQQHMDHSRSSAEVLGSLCWCVQQGLLSMCRLKATTLMMLKQQAQHLSPLLPVTAAALLTLQLSGSDRADWT